jgi:hypothetical protein
MHRRIFSRQQFAGRIRSRSKKDEHNSTHVSGVPPMKWPTLASIFLDRLPALALAQISRIERQVTGKPDTNIDTGVFTHVRQDCTAGPLPVVRLLTPPAHGNVTMTPGRLRATKKCADMEVPALVAIYRSAKDFIGQDNFTLEAEGADGRTHIQQITVKVTLAGAGQGI